MPAAEAPTSTARITNKFEILRQLIVRNWKTTLVGLIYAMVWVYQHPELLETFRVQSKADLGKALLVMLLGFLAKDGDAPSVTKPQI